MDILSIPEEKFWIDKYTPRKFEELDYNDNVTEILKAISSSDDFSHLIFYGPDGAGKKTRIKIFLSTIFGPGIYKTTTELKEIKVNTVNVEYLVVSSTYHIEVNPSDNENHDRHIVQKVIKETASTGNIAQLEKSKKPFKVIVLHDIDLLSKDAQAGLRRTMEKYMKTCRLIMSCSSLTKVINPIRSRCLCIRVAAPTVDEIKNSLVKIQLTENIDIAEKVLFAIAENSDRNLRKAINNFQLTTLELNKNSAFVPEYVIAMNEITNDVLKDQSPKSLKSCREKLMKLLINGVPHEIIFETIMENLMKKTFLNEKIKGDIVNWAAFYDLRAAKGLKPLLHLEAFIAKVMAIFYENKIARSL